MNVLKKILYVFGFMVLVTIFFFKKDLPLIISEASWIICGVLLGLIIILELVTRKRNEK